MSQLTDNLNLIVSIKSDIKSAIENKGVDMTGVSFPDYASKIGEISGGGGSAVIEGLTITSNGIYTAGEGVDGYSPIEVAVPVSGWDQKSVTEGMIKIINLDNSASFVASSAFMNNKNIQTVNLPYATTVGNNAFYRCYSLTQVSLPKCSYIGNEAFQECKSLTSIDLTVCSYIGNYAFGECSSLTSIDLTVCSYIGNNAFLNCRLLSQVSLPVCSHIGNNAFQNLSLLSQVSLPVCSHIGKYAFYTCTSLSQVSLPMCSFIDYAAFQYCSSLSQVSLPVCNYIDLDVFRYCSSLSIITIGYSSVCSLSGSYTFYRTQITSSTGSIYVPASLVDTYKSATNWSYFSTQIFPISE